MKGELERQAKFNPDRFDDSLSKFATLYVAKFYAVMCIHSSIAIWYHIMLFYCRQLNEQGYTPRPRCGTADGVHVGNWESAIKNRSWISTGNFFTAE